jgi:hypothetical protein
MHSNLHDLAERQVGKFLVIDKVMPMMWHWFMTNGQSGTKCKENVNATCRVSGIMVFNDVLILRD